MCCVVCGVVCVVCCGVFVVCVVCCVVFIVCVCVVHECCPYRICDMDCGYYMIWGRVRSVLRMFVPCSVRCVLDWIYLCGPLILFSDIQNLLGRFLNIYCFLRSPIDLAFSGV